MVDAVASTSRVTLDAVDTNRFPVVTKSAEEREVIVISSDEEEEDYDSDCFTTPPLPPQTSQSQVEALVLEEPIVIDDGSPSDIVEVDRRVTITLSASRSSESDSLFDPDDDIDENLSGSEPETAFAMVNEVVKKKRGRPPGRKNGEGIKKVKVSKKKGALSELECYVEARTLSVTINGVEEDQGQDLQTTDDIETINIETTETFVEIQAPESPKALLPDFIFEPPDESMFAELRAFLDQEEARSSRESSDDEEGEVEEKDDDYYERKRLRKLQANNEILLKLGLAPPTVPLLLREDENQEDTASPSRDHDIPMPKRFAKGMKQIKIDSDGTTTSIPPKGSTFEIAYIDMPVLRNRIRLQYVYYEGIDLLPPTLSVDSEGSQQWVDVSDSEKEGKESSPVKTRKRRQEIEGKDEPDAGMVSIIPQKKRRVLTERIKGPRGEAGKGEGTTCHQCRRKTLEPKMRCRYHEQGRVCPLYYCRRCLDIRYDIEFDEDSRTFECPRCSAYCNCSLCLHRAGMQKFVPESINSSLGDKLHDAEGIKKYNSVKHYIEAQVGREFKIGPGGLLNPPGSNLTGKKAKEKTVRVKKVKERIIKEKAIKTVKEKGEGKKRGRKPKVKEQGRPVRKIKLTFKKQEQDATSLKRSQKMTSGEDATKKKRKVTISESMNLPVAAVTITVTEPASVPAIAPKRGRKKAKQIQPATVWVKSRADAFSSSDSESEAGSESSTLTSLSSEVDEDSNVDVLANIEQLEEDDTDPSDTDAEEEDESHDTHQRFSSPSVGHVEYYAPPHPSTDPPFPINDRTSTPISSEPDWNSYQTSPNIYMAGYPSHTNRDLASIMCQLRESGLA